LVGLESLVLPLDDLVSLVLADLLRRLGVLWLGVSLGLACFLGLSGFFGLFGRAAEGLVDRGLGTDRSLGTDGSTGFFQGSVMNVFASNSVAGDESGDDESSEDHVVYLYVCV
jgi:hypothetical protein